MIDFRRSFFTVNLSMASITLDAFVGDTKIINTEVLRIRSEEIVRVDSRPQNLEGNNQK